MRLRTILTGAAAALCICLALWVALAPKPPQKVPPETQNRYWRAVYVLQHIIPGARVEEIAIPPAIKRDDSANGLAYHTDKVFVLNHLAAELEGCIPQFPEAAVYAAYAHMALGQQAEAARLLDTYVAQAPYTPRHYAMLCEALSATADYPTLYLTCLEWGEHTGECRTDRTLFLWTALMHLHRYEEAANAVLAGQECLGYEAALYAARAFLAAGNTIQATELVEATMHASPAQKDKIAVLWQRLQANTLF